MDEGRQQKLDALTPAQRELYLQLRRNQLAELRATEEPRHYPLSYAQQRFWLLEQLHPGEPAHHLSGILQLQGTVSIPSLQQAVRWLCAEHATLRTTFDDAGAEPKATIHSAVDVDRKPVPIAIADLRDQDSEARQQQRARHVEQCTRAAFDLRQPPLMRARLLRLSDADWQLVWCVHHIAADGLSMLVLQQRLVAHYKHALHNQQIATSNDATKIASFHDFAAWTAERYARGEFVKGLAYYREQLANLPNTRLAADFERTGGNALGGRVQRRVDARVSEALLGLGRSEGCTPFVTMLAGFFAGLSRWTNNSDLVVGTPFANRSRASLQTTVGPLINSAVLRCQIDATQGFRKCLGSVAKVVRETFAHGEVPFEQIVAELAPQRQLDRNPLFQVMFNFVDFADVDTQAGDVHWRYLEAPAGTLFDFTLYVRKRRDELVLEAEYDQSLFAEKSMQRRLHELHELLHAAAKAPDSAVGNLNFLPAVNLPELQSWERGAPLASGPDHALDLVHQSVRATSSRAAIHDAETASTTELVGDAILEHISRISAALQACGVRKGDRVALSIARTRWLPVLALAIWRTHATVVPLDPAMPPARHDAVLVAAKPQYLILSSDANAPTTAATSNQLQVLGLEALLTAAQHCDAPRRPWQPQPDAPAYVQFTSGSTGQPKGVAVAHRALAACLRAMLQTLPIGPNDTLLAITSPSFDIAWLEWLLPLYAGGRVHIATQDAARDGTTLLGELTASGATFLQATPSTYRLLLLAGLTREPELRLLCGGEALPDELAHNLRERCERLWNVYGPTETTIWSTIAEVGEGPVRIGKPIPGTNAFVVDENLRRVAPGCPGELCVGGAGVAIGYDALPEQTAQRFVEGPNGERVYRTGDRVRYDHNGHLQFLGRVDEQVKVHGHRVELGAVEATLGEHERIAECALQAVDGRDGVELIAHVVQRAAEDEATAASWHAVWQQTYSDAHCNDPDFDHRGWHDSRTGEPLTRATMKAFVDGTARRIASIAPRRVLEVGCGTGMLVAALAHDTDSWLAIDPAPAATRAVVALAKRRGLAQVHCQTLAADQLDELPEHAFDCVVINSVVQYFPNLRYLLAVLDAARRRLAPGGVVFIGDLRLRSLHSCFAMWVELARSPDNRSCLELRQACRDRVGHEPELLVHEALFDELVNTGAFADRWIAQHVGNEDTEMDRFRADVVLSIDRCFDTRTSLPSAQDNARVAPSQRALDLCDRAALATVGELRSELAHHSSTSPTTDAPHTPSAGRECKPVSAAMPPAHRLQQHANQPHQPHDVDAKSLIPALREHLGKYFSLGVVPRRFAFHEQLPRLPSGKLDRKALATIPVASIAQGAAGAVEEEPTVATADTEKRVAALFADVLGIAPVGAHDDFFACGGHSLAAARLLARMRETFSIDLGLRQVFQTPTVRELAIALEAASASPAQALQQVALASRPSGTPIRPGATMQRLWFLQRLNPGARAYLMFGVVEARGCLQQQPLEQAVADVVQRHEMLRVRLAEQRGTASLDLTSDVPPIQIVASDEELQQSLDAAHGDDLLPLRIYWLRRGPNDHCLAFVLHHAFADGWSIALLRRDLALAYDARVRGEQPKWPTLTVQYLDFAHWQQQQDHTGDRAFWQQELAGAPTELALPTRAPRPKNLAESGRRLEITLDPDTLQRASELARQLGATDFHVTLATFELWLMRLTGQRDLVVGTHFANRTDARLEQAIGCFMQTLPLRSRADSNQSFSQHVAKTRETFLRVADHGAIPFLDLIDAVHAPRQSNRTPIFQAAFEWLNHPQNATAMADVTLHDRPYDPGTSKFELSLVVTNAAPFAGYLEYRSDLFGADMVAAWWRAFACLFEHAVRSPEAPMWQLPWQSAPDQQRSLARGTGPHRTWPHANVLNAWHQQVAERPDAIALRCDEQSYRFADVQQHARNLAAKLTQLGVQPGDCVGIYMPRCREQLLAMLAILQLGAAYVPIDTSQPAARVRRILGTANVRVCAHSGSLEGLGRDIARCNVAAALATEQTCHRSTERPPITPDTLAYIAFTSGSTGEPKGVAVAHRALANYAFWATEQYDAPSDAPLHTQLDFDLSLTSIWPVWLAGGCVTVAPVGPGIEPLRDACRERTFALAKLTPSHLRAWLAANPGTPPASRLVLGGEALDLEVLEPLRHNSSVRFWNEYGPTEATVGCATREILDRDPRHGPAMIGTAIANTRLYVLDEHQQHLPPGVIGELWIAGDSLSQGYFGRDDLTEQRFVADPFTAGERMYQSGDRASFSTDGELYYHGRSDEQRKVRGFRIELGEVRSTLQRLPNVVDAAVIVQRAPSGSEQLIAYVVARTANEFSGSTLRAALVRELPPHAVPEHVLCVAALPFDHNGKLDPTQLPIPWQQEAVAAKQASTDSGPSELLQLARTLLGVPDLKAHDDFFAAGGDSILALQLVARAAELGFAFEIRDVFERANTAALEQLALEPVAATASPTHGPLLPMQSWFLQQQLAVPEHYDQAVWLSCQRPLAEQPLRSALTELVARHPAMRTRITETADGLEQQVLGESEADYTSGFAYRTLDLSAATDEQREQALEALTLRAACERQELHAPDRGKLLAATRVVLLDGATWLYLRAHHLAVDAVSWHVLLRELSNRLSGRALPPPPTSPIVFAQWLQDRSLAANVGDDWQSNGAPEYDQCLSAPKPGTEGNEIVARRTLSRELTRALLASSRGPHRVRVTELLIEAAARSLPNDDQARICPVDLEGHGRSLLGAPDISRTVGWFTTIRLVLVDLTATEVGDRIREIKERVRAAPMGGGTQAKCAQLRTPLLVNYLGVLDAGHDDTDETWFRLLDRDAGTLRAKSNRRSHCYELRAHVRDARLVCSWHADLGQPIEGIAARFETALHELLQASLGTPPLATIADHELATMSREQGRALLGNRDDVEAVYPLTPTQQGMMFASLRHKEAQIYREQLAAMIRGPLDANALHRAFERITARHQLLRGEVHWRGLDQPHWLIRRPHAASISSASPLPFAIRALQIHAGETTTHAVRRRLAELRAQGFAFGRKPLLLVEFASLAPDHHALLVTYHHVVIDGWSMPILLAELLHHYRQVIGGTADDTASELPPAPAFSDHVAFLQSKDANVQRAFWREQLAGFDEPLRLRGDLHEANSTEPTFGECERLLAPEQTQGLRSMCEQLGITTSTVVQAAWALLLARWSGQQDVLFGVTVAGRPPELQGVEKRIGLFINTLPLRLQVEPTQCVPTWLRSLQVQMASLLSHQHTPLSLSQAQTDVTAGTDAFETLVVFENYPLEAAMRELPGGLELTGTMAFERTSYALTLVAIPGDQLCLRLLHLESHYSRPFVSQLLECMETILAGFVHAIALPDPLEPTQGTSLDQVDWLSASMHARGEQFAIGPPAPTAELILPRIVKAACANPSAIAIVDQVDGEERTTTYLQLLQCAQRVRKHLQGLGAGRDALIGFRGCRSPEAIATLLGIWWSGAGYLPIDPDWSEQHTSALLAHAQPLTVIGNELAQLDEHGAPIDELRRHGSLIDTESLAYAVATSGTTGAPKVVLIEHQSLANYVEAAINEFALQTSDRVLQFASFAFDTAAEEIWPTLCAGATLVLRRPEQASSSATFLRTCREQRTTVWDLPTAFFHQLMASAENPTLPPSLRLCIVGGQALERAAAHAWLHAAPSVRLLNTYGPSEATIVATWTTVRWPAPEEPRTAPPIGKPVPGTSAWLLGQDGNPMPPGMIGELHLAGSGLARGYVDEQITQASFVERNSKQFPNGRLYRTGDLARFRPDGQLEFVGRRDRQVKVAGVRIEPDAIEAVLQQHAGINEAHVRLVGDGPEARLIAYIECAENLPNSPRMSDADLRATVRAYLPSGDHLQQFVRSERLPRLVSGKVDGRALLPPAPNPMSSRATTTSEEERGVLDVFVQLFPGRAIAIDDDFFALGGSSLLAVRLLDELHERFRVELPIQTLLSAATPRGIAAALSDPAAATQAVPFEQMQRDSTLPADIVFASPVSGPRVAGILLTGATGFFGQHVLRALLRERVAANTTIHCLIRADDDAAAAQRLAAALVATNTDRSERVRIVRGDVSQPDFARAPNSLATLAPQVSRVIHVAAQVDFLRPYANLRAANVVGTQNVLRFCAAHGLALHHVSSIGVFADPRAQGLDVINEDIDLQQFDRPVGGYAQSKWVGERLVAQAMQRGLRAAIYRPGRLVADSEFGRGNVQDFVTSLLLLCRDLKLVPFAPGAANQSAERRLDVTPVDRAARDLVHLVETPSVIGATLHLVHDDPPTASHLLALWRDSGWTLRECSWADFCGAAGLFLTAHPEHPAARLKPFLRAEVPPSMQPEPRFSRVLARTALDASIAPIPAIDANLVHLWTRALAHATPPPRPAPPHR